MTAFSRLAGRLAFLFSIGRQTADSVVQKGGQLLQLVLTSAELRDKIPLLQQYGFVSRPVPGCDALVIFLGGDRSRPVAISTGDQRNYPSDLLPGEVCLVHPPTGSRIRLQADGSISLSPASGRVTLTGDLHVSGTVTADQDVVAAGISGRDHTHGGVQAGGASTGQPQ